MIIRNIGCEGTPSDLTPTLWLLQLLRNAIELSRFKASFTVESVFENRIKILDVRLREIKHYCGNHPNACNAVVDRRLRRGKFLEGADWVEFDDLVNDVCDEHRVECNFVSRDGLGKPWTLRKGRERRVYYESEYKRGFGQNAEWVANNDRPGSFEDHFGATNAPASEFPEGTPGIHTKAGYAEADHH